MYLAAIDHGLDQLIPMAREMGADLGPASARGLLMQMFETEPEKAAALLSAALVRLGAAAGGDDFLLVLETQDQANKTVLLGGGAVQMTPIVGKDYWMFRVKVSKKQAVVAFPKFSTIGVGFAVEEDWNTNLPYTVGAARIWEHIEHNKGDESIPDGRCLKAIEMVVEAAKARGAS